MTSNESKNYILVFIGPDFFDTKFKEMLNVYKESKSEFKKYNIKAKKMKGNNYMIILYDNMMNKVFSTNLDDKMFEADMILSNVYKNRSLNKRTINKFNNLINYYGIKSKKKSHTRSKSVLINKIINKINMIKMTQGVGFFHKKGKFKGMPTKNHCMLISLGYSPFKNKLKNISI
jgi:hypothetical protein